MTFKLLLAVLLVVGALGLAACSAAAPAAMPQEAAAQPAGSTVMEKAAATPDTVMQATPAAEVAAQPIAATPVAQVTAQPTEAAAAQMPAWFTVQLTEVTTGDMFTIADLKGKVVLVENMAIWCPTCQRQQQQVLALHAMLAAADGLVSLTLDVDPNEDAAALKAYIAKNGFTGLYAVAPADVARAIGQQLGDQFLNPPAAPMFVIDRQGQVHPLPFGVKSAEKLAEALAPFLAEKL